MANTTNLLEAISSYQGDQESLERFTTVAQQELGSNWTNEIYQTLPNLPTALKEKLDHAFSYHGASLSWTEIQSYLSATEPLNIEQVENRIETLHYWLKFFGDAGEQAINQLKEKITYEKETLAQQPINQETTQTSSPEIIETEAPVLSPAFDENLTEEPDPILPVNEEIETEEQPINPFEQNEASEYIDEEIEENSSYKQIEEIDSIENIAESTTPDTYQEEYTEQTDSNVYETEEYEQSPYQVEEYSDTEDSETEYVDESYSEDNYSYTDENGSEYYDESSYENAYEETEYDEQSYEENAYSEDEYIDETYENTEYTADGYGEEFINEETYADDSYTESAYTNEYGDDNYQDESHETETSIEDQEYPFWRYPVYEIKKSETNEEFMARKVFHQMDFLNAVRCWINARCISLGNKEIYSYRHYGFLIDLMEETKKDLDVVLASPAFYPAVEQVRADGLKQLQTLIKSLESDLKIAYDNLPSELTDLISDSTNVNDLKQMLGAIDTSNKPELLGVAPDGFEMLDDPFDGIDIQKTKNTSSQNQENGIQKKKTFSFNKKTAL